MLSGKAKASSPITIPVATPRSKPIVCLVWLGNPGDRQIIALIGAKIGWGWPNKCSASTHAKAAPKADARASRQACDQRPRILAR